MAALGTLQISSFPSVHPHAKALCEVVDDIVNDVKLDNLTLGLDHLLAGSYTDISFDSCIIGPAAFALILALRFCLAGILESIAVVCGFLCRGAVRSGGAAGAALLNMLGPVIVCDRIILILSGIIELLPHRQLFLAPDTDRLLEESRIRIEDLQRLRLQQKIVLYCICIHLSRQLQQIQNCRIYLIQAPQGECCRDRHLHTSIHI